MNNKIAKPLTQKQLVQIAEQNEGFICVVVGMDLNSLVECRGINDFLDSLEHLIIESESSISLGYLDGIDYKTIGFDSQTGEILIEVKADLNMNN